MVTTITSEIEFDALKCVFYLFAYMILWNSTVFYFNVFRSNGLSVVHFYADWSEPCQHMNNILGELASESEFQVKRERVLMLFMKIK